jgi:hypothetical protein
MNNQIAQRIIALDEALDQIILSRQEQLEEDIMFENDEEPKRKRGGMTAGQAALAGLGIAGAAHYASQAPVYRRSFKRYGKKVMTDAKGAYANVSNAVNRRVQRYKASRYGVPTSRRLENKRDPKDFTINEMRRRRDFDGN